MKQPLKSTDTGKKLHLINRQIAVQALLLLLAMAAVYLFISLISFDPADSGWSQTAWHEPVGNLGGQIGAVLSDVFLQFLGFIAYCIPLLTLFFAIKAMIFIYRNLEPINFFVLSVRVIGVLAFIFSASGFFSLNIQDMEQFQAGGVLGGIVADEVLLLTDHFIASMIFFIIAIVCITLLTGLSWLFITEKTGACVVILTTPLIALLFKRKKSRSQNDDSDDAQDDSDENRGDDEREPTALEESQLIHTQLTASEPMNVDLIDKNLINKELDSCDVIDVEPKVMAYHNDAVLSEPPSLTTGIELSEQDYRTDVQDAYTHSAVLDSASISQDEKISNSSVDEIAPLAVDEIVIDENTLPTKILSDSNGLSASHELAINPDYYSPLSPLKDDPLKDAAITAVASGQAVGQLIDADHRQRASFGLDNEPENSISSNSTPLKSPSLNSTLLSHASVNSGLFNKAQHDDISLEDNIELEVVDEQDLIAPIGAYSAIAVADEQHDVPSDTDEVTTAEQEQPILAKAPLSRENIHDSLIHPLLRKDEMPLQKPTTPLPSLNLLTSPPVKQVTIDHNELKAMAELIEQSLADFRVKAKVIDYLPGPVITRFEIELAPGIKAARISTLDRDLARSLSMSAVRVVEVIPGKPYVGIELPNKQRQTVYFREVLDSPQFKEAKSPLTIVLGKDIAGQSVVADLAKMPHLLVAGTTGSGKSVGVNAMILSILYKSQPEDVRFIMIDPKMLELSIYEGIPHLLTEVVTDMKDAANALNWCVNEMERRYRLMSALGVRNIAGYNEKIELAEEMGRPIPDPLWRPGDSMDIDMPMLQKLPYIVVMVDEFADLIMAVGKKVEELIARLAQKARAAGIHLVLATQRPSVDVITGLIKANIPTRIAFTVSSKIDSRTILDQMGAESLLGMGDMLYLAPNSSIPVRVHGAFVRDEEVHSVVQDWKARGAPQYIENITLSSDESDGGGFDSAEEELDPLFDQVVSFVVEKRRASISSVQRQFRIGYNRAARVVEQMENQGIVSAPSHNGNREVLAPPLSQDY